MFVIKDYIRYLYQIIMGRICWKYVFSSFDRINTPLGSFLLDKKNAAEWVDENKIINSIKLIPDSIVNRLKRYTTTYIFVNNSDWKIKCANNIILIGRKSTSCTDAEMAFLLARECILFSVRKNQTCTTNLIQRQFGKRVDESALRVLWASKQFRDAWYQHTKRP